MSVYALLRQCVGHRYYHWMGFVLFLSLGLVSGISGYSAYAKNAPTDHQAAQDLVAYFKDITSLETAFEQITLDAAQVNLQGFMGILRFKKPAYFYYETEAPHNQVITIKQHHNTKQAWIYDRDLAQVTVQPLEQQLIQTPLTLFINPDITSLQQHFHVRAGKLSKNGRRQFELSARDQDRLYEKIRFHFANHQLYEIQIEDSLGQKTVITFENAIYNQPIDTKSFDLVLPEGVDILR